MLAVSCDIVVNENDKFSIQTLDFFDHFVYGPAAVSLSKKMGDMAEIALVRTPPGRLDAVGGHVGIFAKKVEPRTSESLHGAKVVCSIKGLQGPLLGIFDQSGPNLFGLSDHYGIDMLLHLEGAT